MEGTIGEIRMFAGNFAPKTWAFCQGQTIAISTNTALFSILGTTYGGNGTTNFALPDTQGRVVIGTGQLPGGSLYTLGQKSGSASVMLTTANIPPHSHPVTGTVAMGANTGTGEDSAILNSYPATSPTSRYISAGSLVNMGAIDFSAITYANSNTGGVPVPIMKPYLGMNYIICQYGVFPQRS